MRERTQVIEGTISSRLHAFPPSIGKNNLLAEYLALNPDISQDGGAAARASVSPQHGDDLLLKHYFDIGMAIGAEEGLVVPVLRAADRLSFAEIEQALKDFVEQAKSGTLSLDDLRGGTFTLTNGGVFGSLLSTPILNPPQVGILGLHKIEERPIALNGQVVIRPMRYVALSYDHRVVDGREAVQFLVKVKELIEDPETLLLEG